MDDLDFIHDIKSDLNTATLKAVLPSGQVCHISDNVNPYSTIDRCPLLFHAFEFGHRGRLQASIDAPSRSAIVALLRYCYTGRYLNPCVESENTTLLLQVQLYKMAVDFDLPELKLLVHGNFTCQMEAAACLGDPPVDLLDTVRFIYRYFSDQQSRHQHGLVATLRNYCLSTYMYHNLGHSEEFLKIVSEIPAFGQDLCRTNMERDFEDDCGCAIICLPPDHIGALADHPTNALASRDLPDEMLCDAPPGPSAPPLIDEINKGFDEREKHYKDSDTMVTSTATLVQRPGTPRPKVRFSLDQDLSSDDDGYTLVHRPKQSCISANDANPKKMHLPLKRQHTPIAPTPTQQRLAPAQNPDRLIVHHPTPKSIDQCSVSPSRCPQPPPPPTLPHKIKHHSTHTDTAITTSTPHDPRTTCPQCKHRRHPVEYPTHPPTSRCAHGVQRCKYCTHEGIRRAVKQVGKGWRDVGVICFEKGCVAVMREGDVERGVLIWSKRKKREEREIDKNKDDKLLRFPSLHSMNIEFTLTLT
ncbi:hypothetical protein T440DRAFT_391815 [Plenodomus tracheiphilus IPT5]|uniref:BTB domain-containing protein n=1 Tax=Plenodomus tracheiphilus IPT5 TaxID=1408161 RepID=A0A6A7BFI8_9PLEO|nr:hypothetical protein T440DRAFT_391815 [Plenodomus tracheiphilus IPT5]